MKNTLRLLLETITDALFPLSGAEKELFSMSPVDAMSKLARAPETPVPNTYSVFHYKDERVAKMIWNIKYKKSKKAVEIGGLALYNKIKNLPQITNNSDKSVIIIPMPITSRRRKERGYNQCELLLDEVERLFNKKIPSPTIIFEKNLLERTHHTSRQTLKNRADRLDSAKGIFGLNEKAAEKYSDRNCTVIIIDDVITTGSTIKEAMQTMDDVGFEDVIGVSVAH